MAQSKKSSNSKKNVTLTKSTSLIVVIVICLAIIGGMLVFDDKVDLLREKLGLKVVNVETRYVDEIRYVDRARYKDINMKITELADPTEYSFDIGYDAPTGKKVELDFIDVLQGDCIYISFPDGKNMLIDAGRNDKPTATTNMIEYLTAKGCGTTGIDLLMLTHSDADHVGGMDEVLEAFEVRKVYMPKLTADREKPYDAGTIGTKTYEEFVDAVDAEGCTVVYNTQENQASMKIETENYTLDFYCPPEAFYSTITNDSSAEDKNNESSVVILTYAGRKVLLSGDLHYEGELWSEEKLIEQVGGTACDIDIYKMGHHGSHSSTGENLLTFFTPEVAVACVGDASESTGNTYSHPRPESLNRLIKHNCNYLFRSDRHGNITITIGENGGMSFVTEKNCHCYA